MQAPSLVLRRLQSNTMQHPLTGATCVALPNVGMCPQLSCALTFMYLQQVSFLNFFFSYSACFVGIVWGICNLGGIFSMNRLQKCLPLCGVHVVPALRNSESEQKICFNRASSFCIDAFFFFFQVFIGAVYRYLARYFAFLVDTVAEFQP